MPTKVFYSLEDNRLKVIGTIEHAIELFLTEASGELVAEVARNSRVDTGQLKASWTGYVDGYEAVIGSPLENAIWEEFGTGVRAEIVEGHGTGIGRQTGWVYEDAKGKYHFTRGKKRNPHGLLYSYNQVKEPIKKRAETIFKAEFME